MVPLQEQTVKEFETVTLHCQLNKPNQKATWLKDGKEIALDAHFEIIVDGCHHKMVFNQAHLDDTAEYTIQIGELQSTAKLNVEGQFDKSIILGLKHQLI